MSALRLISETTVDSSVSLVNVENVFTDDFDIMCESKAKNLASIDFYNRMTQKKQVVNL